MSMIGSVEFDRAVCDDREVARTFEYRSVTARERAAGEEHTGRFAALPSHFALVDAIAMPGVRMFPSGIV